MKKVLGILDRHLEEWLLLLFLGLIACIMLLQVVMRYAFSSALSWPEEVCRYLYIWSCFVGISYCIRQQSELKIDALERVLRGKGKILFQVFLQIICIALYAYMFFTSFGVLEHIYKTNQLSSAARIPMYLVYFSIPFSLGLAVIRSIQRVIKVLYSLKEGSPEVKEEKV